MVIVIDLTALSYHMTGIERYAACVAEKMLEQDSKNEYRLIFRDTIYSKFEKFIDNIRVIPYILHGDNKVLFYQFVLPFNLYKIKADKYLFLAFSSPILFKRKGIYNTIFDMGAWDVPKTMKLMQKIYWKVTLRLSAKNSKKIITISQFSKNRIVDILNIPKDDIVVINPGIYEGVTKDYKYNFNDIKDRYHLPDKYIMTLSTLEPRKNMKMLLDVFCDIQNEVSYDLVLVGRNGWKMDEVIQKYNIKDRIHMTGFVDDAHVSLIYKNAICFVFPSQYEGFGIPPIEALALGTPVVSSNAASMPEVLMNQAIYFNSNDRNALKKVLINIERDVENMPCELNQIQKENYDFKLSARKVLELIWEEE